MFSCFSLFSSSSIPFWECRSSEEISPAKQLQVSGRTMILFSMLSLQCFKWWLSKIGTILSCRPINHLLTSLASSFYSVGYSSETGFSWTCFRLSCSMDLMGTRPIPKKRLEKLRKKSCLWRSKKLQKKSKNFWWVSKNLKRKIAKKYRKSEEKPPSIVKIHHCTSSNRIIHSG